MREERTEEQNQEAGAEAPVYLTEAELAARWRVTQRTLYNYRRDGRVPPYMRQNQKLVLYALEDVIAFEQQHKSAGKQ